MTSERDGQARYDYIVVGSGAGGGPVACNLAKAGKRVLLLEAGSDYEDDNYRVPVFHGRASEDEGLRWDYFVRHYADDMRQSRDTKFIPARDGVLYPRAGTLGGCTAHNAMITVCPLNQDWDAIAELTGDASWRSDRMRRYFERLEHCQYRFPPRARALYRLAAALPRAFPKLARSSWLPSRNGFGRHGFQGWLRTSLVDPALAVRDPQLLKVLIGTARSALSEDLNRPLHLSEDIPFLLDSKWAFLKTLGKTYFDPRNWSTSFASVLFAGREAFFNAYLDPNDWRVQATSPQGLWLAPLATDGRKRNGTRELIRSVQVERPDHLVVMTEALATKVLFEGSRAIGVEYVRGGHLYRADPNARQDTVAAPQQAFVRGEVILSAGAFNTPQLLKLSGIGPAAELARFGIPVRLDLPGVGENLQDRYEVGVVSELSDDFTLLPKECSFAAPLPGQAPDPCYVEWLTGKGLYTSNGVVLGVIKKSQPARDAPDLFIFGLPGRFWGYYPNYSEEFERKRNFFTWAILKARTRNTAGRVLLRSADPRDVPAINFHYFDEGNDAAGEDLASVVAGVEFVRRMMARAEAMVEREDKPGADVRTREEIGEFVKHEAWGHHASCTCKMGPREDRMAVVDSRFRVHGADGLRVVDASVFPHIPGFFIVTAIYMMSEKASDVILADAKRQTCGR